MLSAATVACTDPLTRRHFGGTIKVHSDEYVVEFELPTREHLCPSMRHVRMGGDAEWRHLLATHEAIIHPILASCSTVAQLAEELHLLMEKSVPRVLDNELEMHPAAGHILQELEALGWEQVVHADPNLTQVTIQLCDDDGRVHNVEVVFPRDFPKSPLQVEVDLPDDDKQPQFTSISAVCAWVKCRLKTLMPLFRTLDLIDNELVLVEPALVDGHCCRSATHRLIRADTAHTSVRIDFCVDMTSPPAFSVFGPDADVASLQARLAAVDLQHLKWTAPDVIASLDRVLCDDTGKLPRKNDHSDGPAPMPVDTAAVCEICYLDTEDDGGAQSNPAKWFECEHCSKGFHLTCMRDWCVALPDARRTFNKIIASCPSCQGTVIV